MRILWNFTLKINPWQNDLDSRPNEGIYQQELNPARALRARAESKVHSTIHFSYNVKSSIVLKNHQLNKRKLKMDAGIKSPCLRLKRIFPGTSMAAVLITATKSHT